MTRESANSVSQSISGRSSASISHDLNLDFETLNAKFLCLNYKLDYQFSELSFKRFEKYLSLLPPFAREYDYNNYRSISNTSSDNEPDSQAYSNGLLANVNGLIVPLWNISGDTTGSDISVDTEGNGIMQITLGNNAAHHLSLFSLSRMYQSGGNKCLFNTNDISLKQIVRNTKINKSNAIEIEHILDNLLYHGELNVANWILCFVDIFHSKNNVTSVQERLHPIKCNILKNLNNNVVVLKKYWQYHIYFGVNCKESTIIYKFVYQLIKLQLLELNNTSSSERTDYKYFYFGLLILFYTQRCDFDGHYCFECGKSVLDHLKEYARNDVMLTIDDFDDNDNSNNNNRAKHATLLNVLDVDSDSHVSSRLVHAITNLQSKCLPSIANIIVNDKNGNKTSSSKIKWKRFIHLRSFDNGIQNFYLSQIKHYQRIEEVKFEFIVDSVLKEPFSGSHFLEWTSSLASENTLIFNKSFVMCLILRVHLWIFVVQRLSVAQTIYICIIYTLGNI